MARPDALSRSTSFLPFRFFFIIFHASPVYSSFFWHIILIFMSSALRPTHSLVRRIHSLQPTPPSKNQSLTRGLAPTFFAFNNASTVTCRNEVARDITCSTSALLPEFVNVSLATASKSRYARISKVKRRIMQVLDEQTKWIMSVERKRLLLELRQHQNPYQNRYQFAYFHTRSPSHSLPHRTFSTSVSNSSSARHPLLIPTHSFSLARTMTFPLLKRGYPGTHHIPTRAELLAQANGTLHRLRLRIKLALMRQIRPWTLNDVTAMFSWFFVGHTVWLLVGTTSCVSLLLFTANTLQFQEWIAYRISKYLTSASGLTVAFDSAIVPNWKEGKISFTNVSVTRMPRSERQRRRLERESGVPRLSEMHTTDERIKREAGNEGKARKVIENRKPFGYVLTEAAENQEVEEKEEEVDVGEIVDGDDDKLLKQYMWFDVTIESVDVTLSLIRWLDGKGLVKDAEVKGVRGTIDRRHVKWDHSIPWDPVASRQIYHPGDFDLETFRLEDMLVMVYQPNNFRPYAMSVFNADISTLRKQWLFYDILSADSIIGTFDQCLFSVHTPQVERSVLAFSGGPRQEVLVGATTSEYDGMTEQDLATEGYRRRSRLRVDGVSVDHLNRGVQGPFGWITSASIDISADIYVPAGPSDSTENMLRHIVSELADRIDLPQPVVLGTGSGEAEERIVIGGHKDEVKRKKMAEVDPKFVMDLDIRFNDTKASVPLQPSELGYLSNAMIRPVVAYINRNKTIVPIKSRVVMDLSNFDGSWTAYDSTLIDAISEQVGRGFVHLVADQQERNRRLKRVGLWGLQEVTRNLMSVYDYARGHRGFWHYMGAATV